MTTVWVVYIDGCGECEGAEIVGVYSSETSAKAACEARKPALDCHRSSIAIREVAIQA